MALIGMIGLAGCAVDSVDVKMTFKDEPGSTLDLHYPEWRRCDHPADLIGDRCARFLHPKLGAIQTPSMNWITGGPL